MSSILKGQRAVTQGPAGEFQGELKFLWRIRSRGTAGPLCTSLSSQKPMRMPLCFHGFHVDRDRHRMMTAADKHPANGANVGIVSPPGERNMIRAN